MKERPILFSAEMVNAILQGRKTQTRRVVASKFLGECVCQSVGPPLSSGCKYQCEPGHPFQHPPAAESCPHGKPGDRLWVRENWTRAECDNGNELIVYQADRTVSDVYQLGDGPKSLNGFLDWRWNDETNGRLKWRPSIFMPRWASRITLELTAVRVERLLEISEEDKLAEGATHETPFGTVWRKINTKPGIRWDDNPWVWVESFKRIPQEAQ